MCAVLLVSLVHLCAQVFVRNVQLQGDELSMAQLEVFPDERVCVSQAARAVAVDMEKKDV
jgi:hypothetical protein